MNLAETVYASKPVEAFGKKTNRFASNLLTGESVNVGTTGRGRKGLILTAFSLELPGQDSNLDKENQNLLCYRYTTG